jgi:hypothetical protein
MAAERSSQPPIFCPPYPLRHRRSQENLVPQKTLFSSAVIDRVGIYASTACVVHCLLTPIVLSLLAVYAHLLPTEEHTHRVLAIIVTLLGAMAAMAGYRKHRHSSVLLLMAVGLTLIFLGAFVGDRLPHHWNEVLITLAGSTCMIAAHRRNHTFCRNCPTCQ